MTKTELENKINDLQKQIEELKQVKIEKDKPKGLFLLSIEEYKKYKNKITNQPEWRLRSPGISSINAASVLISGLVMEEGFTVKSDYLGIRPALYIPNLKSLNLEIFNNGYGDMVRYADIDWIVLDEETGLCLSAYNLFPCKFDVRSNDYETSYIKEILDKISEKKGLLSKE